MKYLNDVTKDCVGKICKSLNSGDFKILKYNNSRNVDIQFVTTGYEMVTRLDCIADGKVKDRCLPSVYGIGVVGAKYPITINDVKTKEYKLWCHMLERCYSDTSKKRNPTYIGCEVSDNFKSYEYFYEWCHKQIGFGVEGFELDKDLLVKGNKLYSENVCIFIPAEINSVLTKSTASRGKHLIGVHWHSKSNAFMAQVNRGKGKPEYLGIFNTELEAFNAYKIAKEIYVKELAEKWKSQIDEIAYNALMSYKVGVDD